MDLAALSQRLLAAARGGRVEHSPFLEAKDAAQLAAELRKTAEVSVRSEGGYPGAERQVVTAYPSHIPTATASFAAAYLPEREDEGRLRSELTATGIAAETLGDIIEHQDGFSVIVPESALKSLLALESLGGRPVQFQPVPLERLAKGRSRKEQVVVPALRVDALGAKAFRVSRSYFGKGVSGGKVFINGKKAGKSSTAELGDVIDAQGLGRFSIVEVQGTTKRGNMKVVLDVELPK